MGHSQSSYSGCGCVGRDQEEQVLDLRPPATRSVGDLEEQVRQLQAQVELLRTERRPVSDEGALKGTRLSELSTSASTEGFSGSAAETESLFSTGSPRLERESRRGQASSVYDSPFDEPTLQKDMPEEEVPLRGHRIAFDHGECDEAVHTPARTRPVEDLYETLAMKKQDVARRSSIKSEWWLNSNSASPRSTRTRPTGRMPRPTLLDSMQEKPYVVDFCTGERTSLSLGAIELPELKVLDAVGVSSRDLAIDETVSEEPPSPQTPREQSSRSSAVDVGEPSAWVEHMGEERRRHRKDVLHNGTVYFCDPEASELLMGQYDSMTVPHKLDVLHRHSVETVDHGCCSSNADDVSRQYSTITMSESDPHHGSWVQDWQDQPEPRRLSCARPASALADLYELPLDSQVLNQDCGASN